MRLWRASFGMVDDGAADRASVDLIEHAAAYLSTLLHCRKQARDLQACQRRDGGGSCVHEEAAFVTCSQEHIGLVVQHLVKVAEKHCPEETQVVQHCRHARPGDDCAHEDEMAIRCAARRVLEAASADARARRAS